eukprot:PITA_13702
MELYGYQPPSITSYLREDSKTQAVEHHIEHQQQVLQLLKYNLMLAQNRMKQQKVLKKIGTIAYKLELPVAFQVHLVFHVSCLNKVIGDKLPVQAILLELDEKGKIILEPEEVIETRTRKLQNQSISKYLIKWKNLSAKDSTWEDENFIQKHPELLKR